MSHIQLLYNTSESSADDISSTSSQADFGHANMLTCPPGHHLAKMNDPEEGYPHQMPDLPFADLWKLLDASRRLRMNGQEITPIMALAALMNDERFPLLTTDDFKEIQAELLSKIRCYG